jgi:hypothetical protein
MVVHRSNYFEDAPNNIKNIVTKHLSLVLLSSMLVLPMLMKMQLPLQDHHAEFVNYGMIL